MPDRYTVKRDGKILHENMSEIEYMDLMEDLAKEYYNTGIPKAGDVETIIIGETKSWQKQKQV
jgi:predicted metal-binding transcription factor (methanogenesis marker protein 9)|tara:strand:+ start:225 stop:413 length:189 start_codon:yes stop_codon:yes gene_type:complete